MREEIFKVTANDVLTDNVFRLCLEGCTEGIRPGQFVNIAVDGSFLRRPVSVCDVSENELTLIIKTVGKGTGWLSNLLPGDYLDILTGLGNGYDVTSSGDKPLLIGGGVGTPPLYLLAKRLIEEGKSVRVLLGFNCADEVFYEGEFEELGCEVTVTTVDGSYGEKGYPTMYLPEDYSYYYTCGPLPLLKAVYDRASSDGEFSFEERMGCGFGACMGCTKKTKNGYKRVCKDGPVFRKEELIWED